MNVFVDVQIASTAKALPNELNFTTWVTAALIDRKAAEVSIRIVDEPESQSLNAQYRGKDKPTNVLSFPFEKPDGIQDNSIDHLLGDLVICAAVVETEAAAQNKQALDHWAHMVVHGILHLQGFDHIENDEAEQMEQMERDILKQLNIADPYLGEHEV